MNTILLTNMPAFKSNVSTIKRRKVSREVSEQWGQWVQHGKKRPSNVYFRKFMRPGDFEAAAALAGPLGQIH